MFATPRPLRGLLAALFVSTVAPAVSYAEQFVLFDVTFTYTKEDADNSSPSKSHYYMYDDRLNPERPVDWTAPVDYRNGTVHVHTEVIDKPAGGYGTQWTLCYIPNEGTDNGYGCTSTGQYTEEGTYDIDVPMTEWWENESIVWTQGIQQMDLVMKDDTGGSGFAHLRPDPEHFFPTTVRIVMVKVSAGSTYDPSQVPGLGGGGTGGAAPTGGSGGTTGGGGGGAGGTGGVGGTGGAAGSSGSAGMPVTAGTGGMSSGGGAGGMLGSGGMPAAPATSTPEAGSCSITSPARSTSLSALVLLAAAALVRRLRRR